MKAAIEAQTLAIVAAIREMGVRPIAVQIEADKVSSGQQWTASGQSEPTIYTREIIVEKGKKYTRQTHPLLFAVVDWLEANPAFREMGVRPIAVGFENATKQPVSKSWAAVAKNYWLVNKG